MFFDIFLKVCYNERKNKHFVAKNCGKASERIMAGEHAGHRKRIIQKLETDTLLDHELLEIMLFAVLPRRNTNDLAHRLLNQFGSLHEVFSAPIEELVKVSGIGESIAAHLRCIGIVYKKHFLEEKHRFTGKFESRNFAAYVKERYEDLDCEVVDVYMLGRHGQITKRHRFTDQNKISAELYIADLSKLLAKESPSGVVIVHNHPFGDEKGSEADDRMTLQCHFICSMHGILLCDHLIYSPQGVYSYYLAGRLQELGERYIEQNKTITSSEGKQLEEENAKK